MTEYWINHNGVEERMTPEAVKAMLEDQEKLPLPAPGRDQEIAELKRQNAEMHRMIEALASGDTGEEGV